MNYDPSRSFGILIAYILPGFVLLWAVSVVSPVIREWLTGGLGASPVIGGVMYATAASIIAGKILNALRWFLIDPIHHATGLRRPRLNDARLEKKLAAFTRLVEDHFRYHQFYANTALAMMLGYPLWRSADRLLGIPLRWLDLGMIGVVLVLLVSSRDALSRYYTRTAILLGVVTEINPAASSGTRRRG